MAAPSSARPYTQAEDADTIALTWRAFHAKYPDRSHVSYRKRRQHLRDEGAVFPDGRSEPFRYAAAPEIEVELPAAADELTREEVWDLMRLRRELAAKRLAQKVQPEVTVRIPTDRKYGVVFMSDFHFGNEGTDEEALWEDVELIRSCPQLGVFVGGDGVDNMAVGKLLAVARDNASLSPDLQYVAYRFVLNALVKQILAIGTGNHDAWTKQLAGIDGISPLLADLPIVNTGERSLIHLYVGEQHYRIFRKHRPVYSSVFNLAHAVQALWRLGTDDFDVGVVEHQHCSYVGPFYGHGLERLAVRTGSYKTRDGFASEFTPNNGGIGTPVVVFDPFERKMTPFMSISDAIEFLEIP
jgi:hypothetical protein